MKLSIILPALVLFASSTASACLREGRDYFCPGDTAVVGSFDGTIISVNEHRARVTIRFSNEQVGTYPVTRVQIAKGCVRRVCVGDNAFVSSFSGTVIGVNSTTDKVSIRFTTGEIGTYMRREGTYSR